jgi:hypothetical protein
MKKQLLSKFSLSLVLLIILTGLFSIIPSCGGGGGGGGGGVSHSVQPVIIAELYGFSTADVPPGFAPSGFNSAASIMIWNDADGVVIADASEINLTRPHIPS